MKKLLSLLGAVTMAVSAVTVTSCGKSKSETEKAVEAASEMTLAELEAASKAEMEASDSKFKVVGLTSVLDKIAKKFAEKYDWIHYAGNTEEAETGEGNMYVNNGYKDSALLQALQAAETTYFADYALVQDVRYFSTLMEDKVTLNYVPSDWQSLGLKEEDTLPLKGVHFNKLFWTNSNFETVNGFKLHNIWQMTKSAKDAGKTDYIEKVSFQTPVTEQINMSFLASCYADENQQRIKDAYKKYFGTDWAKSGSYTSAGEQWVTEFVANISRWHSSDGTAMKETQLKDDWTKGYVYYGAFAKMKDAVGKHYEVAGMDTDPILKDLVVEYKDADNNTKRGVNAMSTVKWDWAIDGFNGFMYTMDSQIVNNAKHPYTACLYARFLLEEDSYTGAIYNSSTPDASGAKANQYGYYYPGTASSSFKYAKGDWTKEVHIAKEINENYEYLKGVKPSLIDGIKTMVGNNGNNTAA